MAEHDAVLVGSGVNALACGALLARAGWSVCVLERNDWFGGAIKTAEMTEPGFQHDVFSAWHPLWVGGAAHALLGDDLAARGLEYLNTDLPTGSRLSGRRGGLPASLRRCDERRVRPPRAGRRGGVAGRSRCVPPDRGPGVRAARHRALVGLGRDARREGAAPARPARRGRVRRLDADDLPRLARATRSPPSGSTDCWPRGCCTPGLGPDAASAGFMAQVIAVAIQEGGMPVPRGGGAQLADALVRLIEDNGGSCRRARGRVGRGARRAGRPASALAGGEAVERDAGRDRQRHPDPALRPAARRLRTARSPSRGRRFRYGRSEMQIHFALSEPRALGG